MRIAASGDPAPVLGDGVPDVTPPQRTLLGRPGRIVDGHDSAFERHYAFSEPLAMASRVFIRDTSGDETDATHILSEGFLVGYSRPGVITQTLVGQVQDLAGNQLVFEE